MVGEKMFQEKGEYYCINGCFAYPIEMTRIKKFIEQLPKINRIDQIVCYDIYPNKFSYQKAMDEEYEIKKGGTSLLETTTLLSLDFFYYELSCQLQVAFLDNCYYCISLVYSAEKRISNEKALNLKKCFYSTLNPVYGNDGYEKWIISLKDIQKDDCSILSNNFYISRELCERMTNVFLNVRSDTVTILKDGIYCTKQSKIKRKELFRSFYDAVTKIIDNTDNTGHGSRQSDNQGTVLCLD